MQLVFWHSPASRVGGGCLTDLTEFEWWQHVRTQWYSDAIVVRIIDVPASEAVKLKAQGQVKILTRQDLARRNLA